MSVMLIESGLFQLLDAPASPVSRYVTLRGEAVAYRARANVRNLFYQRTGSLETSIGVFPKTEDDGVSVEVGTGGGHTNDRGVPTGKYGRILELGGDEHLITPIEANVLRSAPNHIYRPLRTPQHYVLHPGPQARPWLKPALDEEFGGG